MPSAHRFLTQDHNAAAGVAIAASSVLPAEATAFPLPIARQGTARALLTGGYTGAADTALDIEIVSASGSGLLSEPTFAGAGNGALSDLAATGVPAQTFTLLLASTGTQTESAALAFYGVTLEAKADGAAGNGITLEVDASGLSASASVLSFLEKVDAGKSDFTGPEWDFGSYPLTAAGELDSRTPRLRFGHDPQIYRQYKTLSDSEWHYVVDPPIARELPAGTGVYIIAGSYTVAVVQGATTETYTGIVTLFDLLNALKTRSNLIDVTGVVVDDRTPGGMSAEDLPARTDAYALQPRFDGNAAFPGLGAVAVPDTAPTQLVTLTCKDTSTLGGEIWSVKGGVVGDLANCVTGRPYSSGGYGWTVPMIEPPATTTPTGKIYVKSIDFASRSEGEKSVELCIKPLVAGAKATAKTVTVVYTEKPTVDCPPCESAAVTGSLSEACLGVKIEGGVDMSSLPAWYRARLESLSTWHKGFVAANAEITAQGELRAAQNDIALADLLRDEALSCLDDLNAGGTVEETAWSASTAIAIDEAREPAARNGYRYRATVGGTTGSSAPTWPTTIGNTVTDGGVTWKCVSKTAALAWDDVLTAISTNLAALAALGGETPTLSYPATVVSAGIPDIKLSAAPTQGTVYVMTGSDGKAHRYLAAKVQTTGTPTYYGSVPRHITGGIQEVFGTDAGGTWLILWDDLGPVGDTEDVDSTAALLTDPGMSRDPKSYADRYTAAFNEVRAIAGVHPKSEAGSGRSDCWQPCDDNFEWQVNGLEYLPACTNVPYHSVVKTVDTVGNESVNSTQEFGFIIRCACSENLKVGDSFTFVIENDANPVKTYEVGDTITVPVVSGQPLELAGGVDGDDTLTWTVRGSLGAAWPDYAAVIGAEALYDQSGLQFRIQSAGVPFALGDAFAFAVSGGTFRWRRDGGAWSADTAISATPVSLADGLSLTLQSGPDPAFVAGDSWSFNVKQPHAPSLAQSPARGAWRWNGTGASWTVPFAADTAIAAVAIWHDCPAGATFVLEGFDAADATLWSQSVAYRPGLTLAAFEGLDSVADCRKLRVTVANAAGGSLKWVWCGTPWIPEHEATTLTLRESWTIQRGLSAARYRGRGASGEIAWSVDRSWLDTADWAELLTLLDALKAGDDAPFVFVPNVDFADEARLVRIGTDDLDISDWDQFQYSPRRAISVRLPLTAVTL